MRRFGQLVFNGNRNNNNNNRRNVLNNVGENRTGINFFNSRSIDFNNANNQNNNNIRNNNNFHEINQNNELERKNQEINLLKNEIQLKNQRINFLNNEVRNLKKEIEDKNVQIELLKKEIEDKNIIINTVLPHDNRELQNQILAQDEIFANALQQQYLIGRDNINISSLIIDGMRHIYNIQLLFFL